jgi:hypothetical protein
VKRVTCVCQDGALDLESCLLTVDVVAQLLEGEEGLETDTNDEDCWKLVLSVRFLGRGNVYRLSKTEALKKVMTVKMLDTLQTSQHFKSSYPLHEMLRAVALPPHVLQGYIHIVDG